MSGEELPLSCACGTLRGTLRHGPRERSTRLVCYCEDCRAFARFLDPAAPALDADGGSDIFQASPACLRLTHGTERLAAMRLSPKGLIRWYADCCRTPLCNTPAERALPFMGLSTRMVRVGRSASLDELLGPVGRGIQAGEDHGIEAPWPVHAGVPLRTIAGAVRSIGGWRLRGDHKRSPLIEAGSGAPRVVPTVLDEAAREALRRD